MNNTTHISGNTEQSAKPQAVPFLTEVDLRDYFASKAINGMLSALDASGLNYSDPKMMAEHAYDFADAMLAAREVSK